MKRISLLFLVFAGLFVALNPAKSEPIYHEKHYPTGSGPFPTVVALHTSGGFHTVQHLIQRYIDDGFAVYAPDFFTRHGLTPKKRMKTFSKYRENIEQKLSEIVALAKSAPRLIARIYSLSGFQTVAFGSAT